MQNDHQVFKTRKDAASFVSLFFLCDSFIIFILFPFFSLLKRLILKQLPTKQMKTEKTNNDKLHSCPCAHAPSFDNGRRSSSSEFDLLVRLNLTNSNQRTGLKKICNESLLIGRTL
jgi:hypothetical protein